MKGDNIAARLRAFAAGVIQLVRELPSEYAATQIARQLVRSSTSGGANYEEARGAESRYDFVHKLGVANKEVRESLYWLQLIADAKLLESSALQRLIREADELVAILTASIRTTKGIVNGEAER